MGGGGGILGRLVWGDERKGRGVGVVIDGCFWWDVGMLEGAVAAWAVNEELII